MRSRIRFTLTAAAATGLVAVALIGCQPSASPTDGTESLVPGESMAPETMGEETMAPTESPSESASPS